MKSKLLSRATLRRPFVVTVTTVAAVTATACGGTLVDESTVQDPILESKACPAERPTGGGCSLAAGTKCTYGDCGGVPTTTATCLADGSWEFVEMSCNPPPPLEACPAEEPVSGSHCFVDPAETCGYRDCNGVPSVTAKCKGYVWEVAEMSCNPPPPESCPPSAPAEGAPCDVEPTETCEYGDCYGVATITAVCNEQKTWEVAEMSCNPPPPEP
ncbi:MAG: hypothetical protein KIS78_06260 [Labilithrix sp.]|nr:hypothetical protein [Labilithrix sp.]MCW5832041.1 hypothetical protein [Labilithrix sp.]